MATAALGVLLAVAVLLQPLSAILGDATLGWIEAGTDTSSLWTAYQSGPAPDVLFLGDSRVRQDVDVTGIAGELSRRAGHRVTVKKMGLSDADPELLDALAYRVMARPQRPRTVVVAVSEFAFNAGYQPDRTADYWQLAYPPDPGFLQLALARDASRTRLLAGLAVPLVANAPILAQGVQCVVQPSPSCTDAAHLHYEVMTQASHDLTLTYYVDLYLRNFAWSQSELASLTTLVRRIHAGGSSVAFVVLPVNGIAELSAAFYADYLDHMAKLAAASKVPLLDLHGAVDESDWSLWADPSHLNDSGAALIRAQLAGAAAGAT